MGKDYWLQLILAESSSAANRVEHRIPHGFHLIDCCSFNIEPQKGFGIGSAKVKPPGIARDGEAI
jgi:hypothetical protein